MSPLPYEDEFPVPVPENDPTTETMEQAADRLHPTGDNRIYTPDAAEADRHMRAHALQLAMDSRTEPDPAKIIANAGLFYAFLKGGSSDASR